MFARVLKGAPLLAEASVSPPTQSEAVAALVVNLFHIRTYAHLLHLASTSYAQHKALDELYTELPGLVDAWVEAFQGLYGRIPTYPNLPSAFIVTDPVDFVASAVAYVKSARYATPQDSELQNSLDEIAAFLGSVLYKLKNLH